MSGNVKGHNIVLKSFTAAVEATAGTDNATAVAAVPAKAELDIEGTVKTIEVSKFETVNGLKVTLNMQLQRMRKFLLREQPQQQQKQEQQSRATR